MRTPERVYALFVEANPVQDPDLLSTEGGEADRLLRLLNPDVFVDDEASATVRRNSPRGWKPALIAAAFVLVLGTAAYATAWVTKGVAGPVAAETAAMQVTWDGEVCAYEGPGRLVAGDGQVIVARSPAAEDAAILSMRLTDGAVGLAEIQDWAAEQSAQRIPPFVAWPSSDIAYLADDVMRETLAVTLDPGRYVLTCNTAPEGSDRAFPAAILLVTAQ